MLAARTRCLSQLLTVAYAALYTVIDARCSFRARKRLLMRAAPAAFDSSWTLIARPPTDRDFELVLSPVAELQTRCVRLASPCTYGRIAPRDEWRGADLLSGRRSKTRQHVDPSRRHHARLRTLRAQGDLEMFGVQKHLVLQRAVSDDGEPGLLRLSHSLLPHLSVSPTDSHAWCRE